jgi:osmotically-inducible protein OsmY
VLAALVAGGLYAWKAGLGPGETPLRELGGGIRDTATTAAVKTALGLNKDLKPYAIGVSTEDGVVTLRGELPDAALRDSARRVAAAVPDVRQVVDHLRVDGRMEARPADGRTLGESLDDEGLEVQLKLAFSLNRDLKDLELDVRVYKREVRLAGTLPSQALRRLALETAAAIPGVTGVTDELRVAEQVAGSGSDAAAAAERALRANPHLAGYGLEARSVDGRIVLSGQVRTGAERELAALLAREAAGRPVENGLRVRD